MENKYYQPDLTEFHVNFQYEHKNALGEWIPTIYSLEEYHEYLGWENEEHFTEHLEQGNMRVKYLDDSDLIELGWEFDSVVEGDYFYIIGDMIEGNYFLTTQDYRFFYIHPGAGVKKDESFVGKIKNKSEMKKLMKMLNIKL